MKDVKRRTAVFFRRWAPALFVIAAIFFFSSMPVKKLPRFGSYDFLIKKGAHAIGYGLLAAAFWHGFKWRGRLWWLALLLATLYAVTDEFHQSFVPGRHPSPGDVVIDSAGAAIMLALCAFAKRKQVGKWL